MLTKQEQKSKGHPSPDRADGLIMSLVNFDADYVDDDKKDENDIPFQQPEEPKVNSTFTLKGYANGHNQSGWRRRIEQQSDFSSLQEEISEYNRKLLTER